MPGKFIVWCKDEFYQSDSDEREDSGWKAVHPNSRFPSLRDWVSPCEDAREAARWYAEHCWSSRDGYEWSWPIDVVVFDGKDYVEINIELDMSPVFRAGKPTAISVAVVDQDRDQIATSEEA
jgi:hypothetical protein